ncbi:MAG: peptide ABC transporter substrate-binding protein [Firmicutes bacterium HGW-Firmicutes-11]|jgi:oligopeptide transport system substrate-binding protein|nr:MAG: peptide ABC transporter substrate-binding protein [Firmicutes bacterium HGW-Firmicutes-11]
MKKLLVLLLVFSIVFTFAACGGGETEPEGEVGADITVCFASEPSTIDPALNSAVDGAVMLHHAFEGLIKWVDDGDGNAMLAPGMAESWDISDDGTVYTFHIREGALWSDGEPVTANDFEYAWKRVVDPATAADYSYMLDCVLNGPEIIYDGTKEPSELGAVALDDMTFEVTLHTAIPYFAEIAAFPAAFPVRQDIIEANGDQWTFEPETYIGNGPYMMSEWVHNSYITMVKNPNHYDFENLGPNSIKFALMDDDNAMLAAFNSGELDFNEGYPIDEVPALLESGQLKIGDYIGTYYVSYQTKMAPFDDPRVREAFSLAIDRNYIVEQITRAGQVVAGGYVPSGIYDAGGPGTDFRAVGGDYYSMSKDDYAANTERARELLAEAGFPGGEGFPIVEYIYNTNDGHKAVGEALQNMWQQELGVQVTLTNQDWAVFLETRKNGDYMIARNGWIADYNDPISFLDMWVTGGGNNDAQYENPAYDSLIKTAKTSSDPAVRMKAMHDAEDILMGESVVAPIYYYTVPYMVSDDLKGWYYSPLGYFFFSYASK